MSFAVAIGVGFCSMLLFSLGAGDELSEQSK